MADNTEKEWACSYRFDGGEWSISVFARSAAEASQKLRAIGTTGTVDGELMMRMPAYPGIGILVRVTTFIRNLLSPPNA